MCHDVTVGTGMRYNIIVLRIYGPINATRIMTKGMCNKAMAGQMTHRPNGKMTYQIKRTLF